MIRFILNLAIIIVGLPGLALAQEKLYATLPVSVKIDDVLDGARGIVVSCSLRDEAYDSPFPIAQGIGIIALRGHDLGSYRPDGVSVLRVENLNWGDQEITVDVNIYQNGERPPDFWTHGSCGMHLFADNYQVLSELGSFDGTISRPRACLTGEQKSQGPAWGCIAPGYDARVDFSFERNGRN